MLRNIKNLIEDRSFLGKAINYNTNLRVSCGYPRAMCLETTNYCNLHCIMCNHNIMKRSKKHMSFSLFRNIIDQIEKIKYFQVLELQMWGEPLLNPNIFEMIDYSVGKVKKVKLSTNANLLDKKNAKKLIKNSPDHLRISIDANSSGIYNRIRCGGDFKKVIRNTVSFLEMKGKGNLPITAVQLIEMNINSHEINDFLNRWEGIADEVKIIRLNSMGDLKGNYDDLKIKEYSLGWNYTCGTPWNRIYVYSNGDVPFCGFDIEGKLIFGNLHNMTIKEVWNSKEAFEFRNSLIKRKNMPIECKKCREWDMNGTYSWKYYLKRIISKL